MPSDDLGNFAFVDSSVPKAIVELDRSVIVSLLIMRARVDFRPTTASNKERKEECHVFHKDKLTIEGV